MIGAIPSKITAVHASSIGIPQRASVSRIASSPLMTAQVCRKDQHADRHPQYQFGEIFADVGHVALFARSCIRVDAMVVSLGLNQFSEADQTASAPARADAV